MMSTATLLALVLGYACIECVFGAVPSLDVSRPLVRFSPTRGTNNTNYTNDGFGYSAAIHHTVANLSGLTLQEVLEQVRIIAGSPRGRFPGGFADMFPDTLDDGNVCERSLPQAYPGLTPQQEPRCFGLSGLVYLCRANTSDCEPFLGNGNETDPDGYLYRRIANRFLTDDFMEAPDQGLMGATMISNGDYFVACAPRFSYGRTLFQSGAFVPLFEPRGRCVFSDRDLQDFQFLDPCDVGALPFGSVNNQDSAGFCQAGTSVHISESNHIIVGAPGYSYSTGNLGFYTNLSAVGVVNTDEVEFNEMTMFVTFPPLGIPAFSRPDDVYSSVRFTYFGSAVVTGRFNGTTESYVTSSLRYQPANSSKGAINILTSFGSDPIVNENLVDTVRTMLGNQLGESFGKVLVAADLNGDGYDELVVTAPTYSDSMTSSPELGRVYILSNVNQSAEVQFETVATLTGTARLGRFGFAATNLGDLNNDGLEDLAISAPYDGAGVVYIYNGSATNYIESTPHQVIRGEDMVSRISELDSLTSFGAFLQGNTDIDNNEYRDLLIGAEESQALFVLRARPVANISLTVSANETAVVPSATDCVLASTGTAYPCFEVTVCGTYSGRGLTSFLANYNITEIRDASAMRRLIFDDPQPLNFTEAGVMSCNSLTAYVDLEVSGVLDDLNMMVEMQQFQLPTAQVDSTLQFTDLSTEPVIVSEPSQTSVAIAIDCTNNVCVSNLGLRLDNLTYLNTTGQPSGSRQLVVGAITSMQMNLTYYNTEEQALNFQMLITLPDGFTLFNPVTESGVVTCIQTTGGVPDVSTVFLCTDFRVPLLQNESRPISFSWGDFGSSLRGNEGTLSVSAQILVVNRTENFEQNTTLEDNTIQEDIPVVAEATYSVQVTYPPTTPTYMVTEVQPVVESTSQLGSALPITVTFANSGPSTLPGANLVILLPLRNATDTEDYYYLYPLSVNDAEAGISCLVSDVRELMNPSGLTVDGSRRKRRSIRENAPGIMNRVYRTIRQTTPQRTLDCGVNPELCSRLECNLTDIGAGQSRTVVIRTQIDNRFFFDKEADYVLTTFVRVVENSFVNTMDSPETLSAPVTLSMQAMIPDSSGIPDWVIAICVIAGFVFIIIVAVILALLICLHLRRRKRRGEAEIKEDEVETYNEKAFDHDATT